MNPPCTNDPELWFTPARAQEAIEICGTCAHLTPCGTAYRQQPPKQRGNGVWAARDRTPTPNAARCSNGCGKPAAIKGECLTCKRREYKRTHRQKKASERTP